MRTLQIRSLGKILTNKKELEEKLKVKIEIKNQSLLLEGNGLDEYVAEKVIEALDLGFSLRVSLLLLEEDFMLETIKIKELSKKNPKLIRRRLIGTKRKTLDTI